MDNNIHSYNGYHGTSVEAYEQIMVRGFVFEKRKDHWLGNGVYFFLDDFDEAHWFSGQCKSVKYEHKKPCVLNAMVLVDKNKVLNMDTTPGRQRFEVAYSEVTTEMRRSGIKYKQNADTGQMRCVVFDSISSDEYNVILRVFKKRVPTRNQIDEMLAPTHTQICVRNSDCIKDVKQIERSDCYGT